MQQLTARSIAFCALSVLTAVTVAEEPQGQGPKSAASAVPGQLPIDDPRAAIFSPDSRYLAVAGKENILVWDTQAKKERGNFPHQQAQAIQCLVLSSDGQMVVAATSAGDIACWEAATGKKLPCALPKMPSCTALAISPDGKSMAVGQEGIGIYDVATGKERARLDDVKGISALAFSPDNQLALAHKGGVRLWSPDGTSRSRSFDKLPVGTILGVHFSPTGKTLFVSAITQGTGAGRFTGSGIGDFQEIIEYAASFAYEVATGGVRSQLNEEIKRSRRSLGPSQFMRAPVRNEVRGQVPKAFKQIDDGPVRFRQIAPDGKALFEASDLRGGCLRPLHLRAFQTLPDKGLDRGPDLDHGSDRDSSAAAQVAALSSADARRAYQALLALVQIPGEAIPLLQAEVRPVARGSAERVKTLIASLDDDQFAVRQKAEQELGDLGDVAEPAVRQALTGALPSLEYRRRLERVVQKIDDSSSRPTWLRALEALEMMDTAEARQVLEKIAAGDAIARRTQEAQAGLRRLKIKTQR